MKTSIFLFFLILCLSCKNNNIDTQYSPEGEIEKSWSDFIVNWEAEDANGCAEIYHHKLMFVQPSGVVLNTSKEVSEFYKLLFEGNQSSKYFHESRSLDYCDQLAVETAGFVVDWVNNNGEPWTFKANLVAQWSPDETNSWKIKTLIFNMEPEPNENN
jgi:ketosteroid isomerase-like protein